MYLIYFSQLHYNLNDRNYKSIIYMRKKGN